MITLLVCLIVWLYVAGAVATLMVGMGDDYSQLPKRGYRAAVWPFLVTFALARALGKPTP